MALVIVVVLIIAVVLTIAVVVAVTMVELALVCVTFADWPKIN